MRNLVMDYLNDNLSRRDFLRQVTAAGFSAVAAHEILRSLKPITAHAAEPETDTTGYRTVEGTGGDILVEQWAAAGIEFVTIGNSSHLRPVYDAFLDRTDIHPILTVEEGVAVAIASGYSMATGGVGAAAVSVAGAPHCSSNIYNCLTSRLPVLVATDMVPARFEESEGIYGGRYLIGAGAATAKWHWTVSQPSAIADVTRRAIKVAKTPPGGPVQLTYPSDVLAKAARATIIPQERFDVPTEIRASSHRIEMAARMLLEARSPCMYVDSEAWKDGAQRGVVELAELIGMPAMRVVLDSWTDCFPTSHDLYINAEFGDNARFPRDVDVLLVVGGPLLRPTSARTIHITAESDELGKARAADVPILADTRSAVRDIKDAIESMATPVRLSALAKPRRDEIRRFNRSMEKSLQAVAEANWDNRPISWQRVAVELDRALDKDALIVDEISTEKTKLFSYIRTSLDGRHRIGRNTSQALGWGVGLAIGAKLGIPNRQVVGLVGDGAFLFGQCEALWSMSRYDVPVLIVVMNNRGYNEPRQRILGQMSKQGQTGQDVACYLGSPDVDFAKIGAAFGIAGEVVEDPGDLRSALRRAVRTTRDGRPYIIDVVIERTGIARESTWYPAYSAAERRTRRV